MSKIIFVRCKSQFTRVCQSARYLLVFGCNLLSTSPVSKKKMSIENVFIVSMRIHFTSCQTDFGNGTNLWWKNKCQIPLWHSYKSRPDISLICLASNRMHIEPNACGEKRKLLTENRSCYSFAYHKCQFAHVNIFEVFAVVGETCEIVQIEPSGGRNDLGKRSIYWKCIATGWNIPQTARTIQWCGHFFPLQFSCLSVTPTEWK